MATHVTGVFASWLEWAENRLPREYPSEQELTKQTSCKRTHSDLQFPDDSECAHTKPEHSATRLEVPLEALGETSLMDGDGMLEARFQRLLERMVCHSIGLERVPKQECVDFLLCYTILASAMLVLNKQIIWLVKHATELLLIQLGGATIIVLTMHATSTTTVRLFPGAREAGAWVLVAIGFLASVYCSVETLRYSDVAWYMVLHYIEPLGVCMLDWLWLNHRPPTFNSIFSILVIITSSVWWMWYRTGNLHPDQVEGVFWGTSWVFVMVIYLTYLKYVVNDYPMATPWERVLYLNMYAFIGLMIFCGSRAMYANNWSLRIGQHWETVESAQGLGAINATRESSNLPRYIVHLSDGDALSSMADLRFQHLHDASLYLDVGMWDPGALTLVLLSCVCGTGLSYTRLMLLTHISATSYAMFSVVALLPVRVWQVLQRVG